MPIEIPANGGLRIRYRPKPNWPVQDIRIFWDQEDNDLGTFFALKSAILVGDQWQPNPFSVVSYLDQASITYQVQQAGGIGPWTNAVVLPLIKAHLKKYYDVTPDDWQGDISPNAPFKLETANTTLSGYFRLKPSATDSHPDAELYYRDNPLDPPPTGIWDYT